MPLVNNDLVNDRPPYTGFGFAVYIIIGNCIKNIVLRYTYALKRYKINKKARSVKGIGFVFLVVICSLCSTDFNRRKQFCNFSINAFRREEEERNYACNERVGK